MKSIFKRSYVPKTLLMIAVIFLAAFQSSGQQSKPSESGYAPVNGIKVYYEVYGEGRPLSFTARCFLHYQHELGRINT